MMVSIPLLLADAADLTLSALLQPSWGIFINGVPVIQPATILGSVASALIGPVQQIANLIGVPNIVPVMASTVEFEFAQDFPLSNYPQEGGAFQSYNKVTLPFDVKLKLASNGNGQGATGRQAFLQTCLAIANSTALFDIMTPELVFASCNCSHIDWPRKADRNATLIEVELYFQQINNVQATNFTNTASPTSAGQQSLGNVQPQVPDGQVQNALSSAGVM